MLCCIELVTGSNGRHGLHVRIHTVYVIIPICHVGQMDMSTYS
jgi:hypothetical protein